MRAPTAAEREAWEEALDLWGVDLHDPVVHTRSKERSFAWFGFPPEVNVDPGELARHGGEGHLTSVFAHEIGHHVLSPSTRVDSLKIRQQMARVIDLYDRQHRLDLAAASGFCANLWSDMLINDRVMQLQRARLAPDGTPDMVQLTQALAAPALAKGLRGADDNELWWVVQRAYELLWRLPEGTLAWPEAPTAWRAAYEREIQRLRQQVKNQRRKGLPKERADRWRAQREVEQRERDLADLEYDPRAGLDPAHDATTVADVVRTLAADPVSGAVPWAMVMVPYLLLGFQGTGCHEESPGAPTAAELAGAIGDPRLQKPLVHPEDAEVVVAEGSAGAADDGSGQALGLARTLELLAGADPNAVMAAWYEAEARPHVAPLVQRGLAPAGPAIPGPLEEWGLGDDLAELDWPATLTTGAVFVPGVTTRRRTFLPDEPEPDDEPVLLDLYLDSSGSMTHPQRGSAAIVAGTILSLSVLRGGGRVRVTSWSSAGQVAGDSAYTRDRVEIMRQLTTYFGGGTTFPLDLLRARYPESRRPAEGQRHLVVLSDAGLDTFLGRGQEEYADVAAAVRRVIDTGSLMIIGHWRGQSREQAERLGYDVAEIPDVMQAPAACAALAARIAAYTPEGADRG
ncbi:Mg-chelatase subunit ChlD [Nocardioides sp. YR527]|uniref:vWA domain-containing protein n=1 Tax=Nocardioides sp. YR527 TaxID=1881028 RepID=UPI000891F44E|nr:vWA domain-containing protein [Nocardioides sp. YR527]SDJ97150.1 Mg-chelatase subunit ChlD [Nocardioides sp. YR527]